MVKYKHCKTKKGVSTMENSKKSNDFTMDLQSYKESLIGGGFDLQEVNAMLEEMEAAKVGTIKANCWEKISESEYIIYSL